MSQLYPPYHPHKSVSSPTSSFWWLGALSVSAFVGWVWGNRLRANEMRKKRKTLGKNSFGCAPWSSVKVRRLPYSALPQSTKQVNHITVDLGTVFLCQQMQGSANGMGLAEGNRAAPWKASPLTPLPAEDGLGFIYITEAVNILGNCWNLVI